MKVCQKFSILWLKKNLHIHFNYIYELESRQNFLFFSIFIYFSYLLTKKKSNLKKKGDQWLHEFIW